MFFTKSCDIPHCTISRPHTHPKQTALEPVDEATKLAQRIELRKSEATNKQYSEKAIAIAVGLGDFQCEVLSGYSRYPACVEARYTVESLAIEWRQRPVKYWGMSREAGIWLNEETVYFYSSRSGITTYIPGSWESIIESLYAEAQPIAQKVQSEIEAQIRDVGDSDRLAQASSEAKKWGL